MKLSTANRNITPDDVINVACPSFEEEGFVACVLPSTPTVSSIDSASLLIDFAIILPHFTI